MFRGTIEYLVPARGITPHLERTVENLFRGVAVGKSTIRVHLDGNPVKPPGLLERKFPGKVAVTTSADSVARGPAKTRNLLARESRARYLVFVDSDIILPEGFDFNLRAEVPSAGEAVIYPRILGRTPSFWVSHFFQEHVMAPKVFENGTMQITSAVFGLHRALWRRLPDFDEAFVDAGGEDYKFFREIQDTPYSVKIFFAERLRAIHENPTDLQTLLNRARRYGKQAHLHTTPSNMMFEGVVTRASRTLGNRLYRALEGLNEFVASSPRRGSLGRIAARLAVETRDLIVSLVRMVRRNSDQRYGENLSALLVERIRYSDVMAEGFDYFSGEGRQRKDPSLRPFFEAQEANRCYIGPGRTVHSPHHSLFHRPFYFLLRFFWVRAYRRSWVNGYQNFMDSEAPLG